MGDSPKSPNTAESNERKRGFCGTVVALDEAEHTVDLKRGRNSPVPHPSALVPLDAVNRQVLRDSLLCLGREVASDAFAAESARRAAFDPLRRVPARLETAAPRAKSPGLLPQEYGVAPEDLVAPAETPLDAARRIAPRLDCSVLPVQKPPGSDKTYAGARLIHDLLAAGKRVGVTANSHKVISNLLGAVCRAADERPAEGAPAGREQGGVAAESAAVEVRGNPEGQRRGRLPGRTHRPDQRASSSTAPSLPRRSTPSAPRASASRGPSVQRRASSMPSSTPCAASAFGTST